MSLLLTQIGAAVAPDQLWPELTDTLELHFDGAEFDLSFTYGPPPADVIAAADLLANVFEDNQEADEFDYSFSFTLLEDAQLYAAQFETEETPDETDHSFAAGPLSDDFVAPDDKVYGLQADDEPETEEADHSFTFTLLEDAQVYGLGFEDDVSPTDEIEYDFSLSLQDDFVIVADEPPYQHFDEYDEAFEGDEYSFYLGNVSEPVEEPVRQGGAWLDESQVKEYENEKKRRRDIEREIEETITLAYQRLTGKITPPPAVIEAKGDIEKLAIAADKIAAQLVSKANKSDKFKARNRAIIADLKRLAREITEADALALQIEEEAIVFLLAA
jgi:hypothetical protein